MVRTMAMEWMKLMSVIMINAKCWRYHMIPHDEEEEEEDREVESDADFDSLKCGG